MLNESGTYASTSGNGVWMGQVMSHEMDEKITINDVRYLGVTNRNVNTFEQGPIDYTGTISYRNQDFRLWGYALGSITDTSGTNSTHVLSETNNDVRQSAFTSGTLNPPMSFSIEDSKVVTTTGKNFIRTVNGAVPQRATLNLKMGEPVITDIEYVAQTVSYSSGATTSVTQNANRPYLWSDALLTIGGSVIPTVKEITLEIDNTSVGPHYANGSKVIAVPFHTNRNYTLNVTLDHDSESTKPFYDQFFLGGSSFNVTLDLNADGKQGVTGSMHTIITMSGCRMHDVVTPSPNEGVVEQQLVIRPGSLSITAYDRVIPYGAW